MTIYDNASTDDTEAVIRDFMKVSPCCEYVKRPVNIGGNANIVMAYASAKGRYAWVLCDDDIIDASKCEKVLPILEQGRASCVFFNALKLPSFPQGNCLSSDIRSAGARLYYCASFVPGVIYRLDQITTSVIQKMLLNMSNAFSQIYLIDKIANSSAEVYVADDDCLMRDDDGDIGLGWVSYTFKWILTLQAFQSWAKRDAVFLERFSQGENKTLRVMKSAVYVYIFQGVSLVDLFKMWMLLPWWMKFPTSLIALLSIFPRSVLRGLLCSMKPSVGSKLMVGAERWF